VHGKEMDMKKGMGRVFVVLLGLGSVLSGFLGGCVQDDQQKMVARTEDIIRIVKEAGVQAEGELVLSPDGAVNFGPGVMVTNQSYIKVRIRVEPSTAVINKLAEESATEE